MPTYRRRLPPMGLRPLMSPWPIENQRLLQGLMGGQQGQFPQSPGQVLPPPAAIPPPAVVDDGQQRTMRDRAGGLLYSGPGQDYNPFSGSFVPYSDEPKNVRMNIGELEPARLPPPNGPRLSGTQDGNAFSVPIKYKDGRAPGSPFPAQESRGYRQTGQDMTVRTLPRPDSMYQLQQSMMGKADLGDLGQYAADMARAGNYQQQAQTEEALREPMKNLKQIQADKDAAMAEKYRRPEIDYVDKADYTAALNAVNDANQALQEATINKGSEKLVEALQKNLGQAQSNLEAIRRRINQDSTKSNQESLPDAGSEPASDEAVLEHFGGSMAELETELPDPNDRRRYLELLRRKMMAGE